MKIIVLGIRGIPGVQGGIETHAEHLYTRLAGLGCDIEVIVRTPFVAKQHHFFGAIRLRRIWSPRRAGYEALIHSILGVFYAAIVRPDLLHIHAIGPAIVTPLARCLGLRVVVTHHGPDYDRDKWGWFARRILRVGEKYGMLYSNARIAISRVVAELIRTRYQCDSVLIPNGVEIPAAPTDRSTLEKYGLSAGRYVLLVSRMVPEKRQLDLIRAFNLAQPNDWKLALVGGFDGNAYEREVRSAASGRFFVLTGFVTGEPLRQLYAHAGLFVLPSSHEGLPIALLEALSYGLPVLASNIPANLEVGLGEQNYFPLGDVTVLSKQLSAAMSEQSNDADARRRRIEFVKLKYDWDRIAQQTLDVYRQVQGE